MKSTLRVPLFTTTEQFSQLEALQMAFAQVCNALAPEVRRTRVWNRVVMHHMHYKYLRERFPELGSQMVCNAIHAVSRTSRMLFQVPTSPFYLERLGSKELPLMQFQNNCPVLFDRHTLSINGAVLSLFTLNGRIKFEINLKNIDDDFKILNNIQEIYLYKVGLIYELNFIYKINLEREKNNKNNTIIIFKMPEYLRIESSI
jgi:hypothetical protein